MTRQGMLHYKMLPGSCTSEEYSTFIVELISVCRGKNMRRGVFSQDNARPHSRRFIEDVLDDNDVLMVNLPPYSPFLNPIENCFSIWKKSVRDDCVMNVTELYIEIDRGFSIITPENCSEIYQHLIKNINIAKDREPMN